MPSAQSLLIVMDLAPRPGIGLNRESPKVAAKATCMRGDGSGWSSEHGESSVCKLTVDVSAR